MKTIEFEIISSKNPQISQMGYVEVPADEEEMPEWFYYDQSGIPQPRMFTHHDGIGINQIGATDEQEKELDEFLNQVQFELVDFVDDTILLSEEDEHKTYQKGDLIIKINGGAVFEVGIEDYNSSEWDVQYHMAFTPKFNGEIVELDDDIYFEEPFTYEDIEVSKMIHENGAYIIEVPKMVFEDPEETEAIADIFNEYKDAFECAYTKSLVRELGVYGIAHSFITERLKKDSSMKVFDKAFIQDWANSYEDSFEENESLIDLYFMTSDDVETIIKAEYEEELQNARDAQRDYEMGMEEREMELKEEFNF